MYICSPGFKKLICECCAVLHRSLVSVSHISWMHCQVNYVVGQCVHMFFQNENQTVSTVHLGSAEGQLVIAGLPWLLLGYK